MIAMAAWLSEKEGGGGLEVAESLKYEAAKPERLLVAVRLCGVLALSGKKGDD